MEELKVQKAEIFTLAVKCKVRNINLPKLINKQEQDEKQNKLQNCIISRKNSVLIEDVQYKFRQQIFKNGSLQLTGLKSLEKIKKIVIKVIQELGQEIEEKDVYDINASTINSTTCCNCEFIDLGKLFKLMRDQNIQARYQNTSYQGLVLIMYVNQEGKVEYTPCVDCKKIDEECFRYDEQRSRRSQKNEKNERYFELKEVEYKENEDKLQILRQYKTYYKSLQKKPTIMSIQKQFQKHCYKVSVMIFRTGQISIMGCKRVEDKDIVVKKINQLFEENYKKLKDGRIIRKKD